MPRVLLLPVDFQAYEFAALARSELDGRVRLRLLALAHLQEAKTPVEVATLVKVHEKPVVTWLRRFRRAGLAGLQEQPGRGAKQRLAKAQEPGFKAALQAAQAHRSGGRVTGEDMRQLLVEQFGVRYSLNGVYAWLARLRLVWITARSTHPQHDALAQEAFKKTSLRRSRRYSQPGLV
jgi:transposase